MRYLSSDILCSQAQYKNSPKNFHELEGVYEQAEVLYYL